jgi:hypothetical protein
MMSSSSQLTLDWTLTPLESRVVSALRGHVGRAAAIRVPDLASMVFGVDYYVPERKTLERKVQDVVKRLREEHGQPILSSAGRPAGYYMAATTAEVEQCVAEHRRKAIHTLTMLRALRRHLARLRGQQELVPCIRASVR